MLRLTRRELETGPYGLLRQLSTLPLVMAAFPAGPMRLAARMRMAELRRQPPHRCLAGRDL